MKIEFRSQKSGVRSQEFFILDSGFWLLDSNNFHASLCQKSQAWGLVRLAQAKKSVLFVGIVFLVATMFIACARGGSDLEERVKLLETSRNEMAAQLRIATVELDSLNKGQLVAILDLIDRADIHHMDDNLQEATRINRLYVGAVIKLRRALVATSWPAPLKGEAEAFKVTLAELETALTKADLTVSRKASRKAHLSYHALVDKGWKLVAGEPIG